jgi:methionyl aminopeptidase
MDKLTIKNREQLSIMAEGGKKLGIIKKALATAAKPGTTVLELDRLADRLIFEAGAAASFKMVRGYHHATCISVNEEVVHGIPTNRKIRRGDLVSIDVGLYYRGFHTDTSTSVRAGVKTDFFLEVGRTALNPGTGWLIFRGLFRRWLKRPGTR